MGGLLSFRMKTILASFHDVGMLLRVIERLNMFVLALMVCVPKFFKCKFEMPSEPVDKVFLSYRWSH